MPTQVIINWGVSSFYGWGVYGLNLALAWSRDPDIRAMTPLPLLQHELVVDPLRHAALTPFGRASARFQDQLRALPPGEAHLGGPLLMGLHQAFEPLNARPDVTLIGKPTIGVTFFQDTHLAPEAVARAAAYPAIVAGSTWNARLMQAHGLTNVTTILQGVDPALFHPGPKQDLFPGRFLVFSGGKLERRKGQDIVIAAFRRFAERHPDAVLVTAWSSPFAGEARTFDAGNIVAPLVLDADGKADVRAWAKASGIPGGQVLDLGPIPNPLLPAVLREMDVALFPNRAEGGTNLVAMEAMACGVPTILSRNTGHRDLIEDGNAFTLDDQRPLAGAEGPVGDVEGWGESDFAEAVAALEQAYADRAAAQARGRRGAETLSRLTWAETARRMKALILG